MFDNKKITVEGKKLLYKSHILIETKTDIVKYLVIDDIIVILIAGSNLNTDRNVFGYDLRGNLKWQIAEPSTFHERNYYTSIYLSPVNALQAYNQNGVEVTINKEDGTIIERELIK